MRRILAALLLLSLWFHGVQAQVDSMTLEQQVAQMFMVSVYGAQLPEVGRDFLQRWQPGAMVLFSSNAGSPEAVTQLINSYQQSVTEAGGPPLLIAVDQEGGVTQRLRDGMTALPMPLVVTATHDPELAYGMGSAGGPGAKRGRCQCESGPGGRSADQPR